MHRNIWILILMSSSALLLKSVSARGALFERIGRQLLKFPLLEYPELGMELINSVREEHSTGPLKMNPELQASAQAAAIYLASTTEANATGIRFGKENSDVSISQNFHLISNEVAGNKFPVAVVLAIAHWYDEELSYDYDHPKPSNFTQMIWKSSTDMGLGVASQAETNNTVVVAHFSPSPSLVDLDSSEGIELYKLNVLRPIEDGKNVRL